MKPFSLNKRNVLGIAIAFNFALVQLPGYADDDKNASRIKIVEPGKTLFRKSYNELSGAWWNWALKEPIATNVVLDSDGSLCDLNQKGKVFFLAGTFGGAFGEPAIAERTCNVPAGKGIFFPILNGLSFAPDFPGGGDVCFEFGSTIDDVRCDMNDDVGVAPNIILSVVLNGESEPDLFAYRAQTEPGGFELKVPEGSLLTEIGFPPGDRDPAVADGYWIYLKPLPPGIHYVSFSVDFDADGTPDLGANYTLLTPGKDHDD